MTTATSRKDRALDERIARGLEKVHAELIPPLSRKEIDTISKDLELGLPGGVSDVFPRFAYGNGNYSNWETLASKPPYSQMHEALEEADKAIMPKVAAQIAQKGIKDIYSMGPTPSLDKLLLEHLVRQGTATNYHPVDAGEEAIRAAVNEARQHLTARFGNTWQNIIHLIPTEPARFEEVQSTAPSCVVYSGGTVMNNRRFWEQAAKIAQPGGLVVASSAVSNGEGSEYWRSIYDTPEGRQMSESGLRDMLPGLFIRKNRRKLDLKFDYVGKKGSWDQRWGLYQTPRVSVEMDVKEPIALDVTDPKTDKPVRINVKPSSQRRYPVTLFTSSKLDIGEFLQSAPKNFGLRRTDYVVNNIDYTLNGKQGKVAAAVFEVGKPQAGAVQCWDLQPKQSQLLR